MVTRAYYYVFGISGGAGACNRLYYLPVAIIVLVETLYAMVLRQGRLYTIYREPAITGGGSPVLDEV